ncbi:MAG: hypothetical protein ABGX04_16540 [Myxococcales bacterium]|nr:dihydrodipicolinate reductase [Myxococcales bacterium]HIK84534.1 dihydrodipicolinate reductase [Myxococcales bacterium]
MTYRVVQWSTGNLGRAAIEGIVAHPELELVGVWVHSESKDGVDAGELAGIDPLGIRASRDIDALLALAPDCILYSPLFPKVAEIEHFLSAGINVVTPLGWFYTKHMNVEGLEKACQQGHSTLHGTGIHPGGMTERIPLMVSSFSQKIGRVRAEEYSDCRTYGAPDVLRDYMMFGKDLDEARKSPMTDLLRDGFYQSIDMIADEMGFRLDPEKKSSHEVFAATAPIETPIGPILPGQLAAQRFAWEGTVDGEVVITAAVNWYMGHSNIDPKWSIGEGGERYELEIAGDPPITAVFHGIHPTSDAVLEEVQNRNPGIVSTANHCVSSIPYVCNADEGIKSYLDLPLIAGRARLDLT